MDEFDIFEKENTQNTYDDISQGMRYEQAEEVDYGSQYNPQQNTDYGPQYNPQHDADYGSQYNPQQNADYGRQYDPQQNADLGAQYDPQYDSGQASQYDPQKEYRGGFGLASLILGIAALLSFCTCINIVFIILSVVFGILHITRKTHKNATAVCGIVLSGLSLALMILMYVLILGSFSGESQDDLMQQYEQYFDEGYSDGDIRR